MTNAQLATLLEGFSDPVCVRDEAGTMVAANRAGQDLDWSQVDPQEAAVVTRELGDGWTFFRRPGHLSDTQTLARGIAHEIRNPLSAILTAVKLVQDDQNLAEETSVLLDVIKKESLRMNRILSEFSTYVKPMLPQPTVFNCATLLRRELQRLQRDGVLPESITISEALPEQLLAYADEEHVEQVVHRVLRNAGDAMANGGELHLTGERQDNKVVLQIADSGPGFSPEALRRAFQPFFSKRSQGSGLGLAIARAAMDAVGGRISIENLERCGALVCIELPGAPLSH